MYFTNVFYYIYFILFSLHNEFTYTTCSLLSRVKNPVEHILTTTPESWNELPRNIYSYEPYRGHRTLWRPTTTNIRATLKQKRPLPSRTGARIMKLQNRPQPEGLLKERSTIQSYWHHFDDDEEAWPKVVLLMSSTKRTTTRRKYSKKTFATYFPHLNQKYTTTEHTNSKNDKYEGYNVKVTLKTKNFATNTISLNTNRISDVVIHLRLENDTETKEAKDVEAERRTDVNTTTWKNSSNIETKINDEEAKAKLKKEEKVVKPNLSLEEVSEQAEEEKPKPKEEPVTNQYLVPKMEPKVDADEKGKNKTTRRADIRCYQCGLKSPKVPNAPTCRQAFAGDERKYFFLKPRYKVKCGKTYKDGCFTRYLDIGATYDERGCRTMPPLEGKSFASRRMARLEKALHNLREGCITSPHASLTPFSRSISLFTRYHVCVCVGRYCNQGNVLLANSFTFIVCLFSTTFVYFSCLTR